MPMLRHAWLATTLCLVCATSSAQEFEIELGAEVSAAPVTGRVLLLLSRTERFSPGENGTPVFGLNVEQLAPGESVTLDAGALGHPVRSLREIPAGEYYAQAYLHVYTRFERADGHVLHLPMDQGEGQRWRRSPGNHFSKVTRVRWDPASPEAIQLQLCETIPPIPPRVDTQWVKHVRLESELLSEFWGRPMTIGATVLLPSSFHVEPERRYPVVYMQGHFSSRAPRGFGSGRASDEYWQSEAAPQVLFVTLQHANPYYDDSYGVNSENLGPYGDALVQELIPEVERRFRAVAEPHGRVLTGGSTGGWIAVAMQVFYPDFFGGCWSFYPDQVDFRCYQIVDILEDENAYFIEHEWSRVARPGKRRTNGSIVHTMEQENLYEEVIGTRCRSGGQWAIWNAVFAPVAEDGYPQPLWDPLTGAIDHEVARWARERYDLRHILERDWPSLGPKLVGKLHLYVGRMDNYYLEGGVYHLESFLESSEAPHYGGTIEYGDRGGHGWSPFEGEELLETMAQHMTAASPGG